MKKSNLLFLSIVFLCSCAENRFFQVYKTSPQNSSTVNNEIVFENQDCRATYDLWSEYGDSGFYFFNKTSNDMTIDLSKSFFVLNGIAHSYYQGRILADAISVSYVEQPELTIPPLTKVKISEYKISNTRFTKCDFIEHPTKKEVQSLKFDMTNSPLVFYNTISYKTSDSPLRMENKFYVSEITNLPASEMFQSVWKDECGKKWNAPTKVHKLYAPDKFYIEYRY